MGFMDKAKEMLGKHDDKVDQGIDKASDMVDEKTGGQYSDKIDKAQDVAKEKTGEGDTTGGEGDTTGGEQDGGQEGGGQEGDPEGKQQN